MSIFIIFFEAFFYRIIFVSLLETLGFSQSEFGYCYIVWSQSGVNEGYWVSKDSERSSATSRRILRFHSQLG